MISSRGSLNIGPLGLFASFTMENNKARKRKSNGQQHQSNQNGDKSRRSESKNGIKSSSLFSLKSLFIVLVGLCIPVIAILYSTNLLSTDNTFVPFDGKEFSVNSPLGNPFWGSLLSGHYFGLRASSPKSPIVSMMWLQNKVVNNGLSVRHWCSQDDRLERFFWNYNDLNFGHQSIQDKSLHINTSFIRLHGNTLKARINFFDTSKNGVLNSVILYSALEDMNDNIEALDIDSFDNNLLANSSEVCHRVQGGGTR